MKKELAEKLEELKKRLREMDGVLIAYSGGVDSTFLAEVAHETCGDRMLAVTVDSIFLPRHEFERAAAIAKQFDFPQQIHRIEVLDDPTVRANPKQRCYYCKHAIFSQLQSIAAERGGLTVCDGSNTDDDNDFRPGHRALRELGVRSPLKESGMSKQDIRMLSKDIDLPTWHLPSAACLASRIPYGTELTAENLEMVEKAEDVLRDLGLAQIRVRHHGAVARIETSPEGFAKVAEHAEEVTASFRELGFAYTALDLEGYRTGSLNETPQ